jgi:hypothetical protein
MSDNNVPDPNQATTASADTKQKRQRSAVAFAYMDLTDTMAVASAIHEHVGNGDCDEHQLSAWIGKSHKSSTFRILLSTARLFGLIEADAQRFKLTPLGRRAVDPTQARDARARAFLSVPLYSIIFENHKGGVLPPAAALEREMAEIGVAGKQIRTARLVMERSAQYANFTEHGKDRWVMPGIAPNGERGEQPPKVDDPGKRNSGGDGGDGTKELHPFIEGLLRTLPDPDSEAEWPLDKRVKWLQTAANIFDLIYKGEGGIDVRAAMAQRSPRPHDA